MGGHRTVRDSRDLRSGHLIAPFVTAPLVSVVIPAYNGSRFISQTLTSVLRQTWFNLEIIVVDDGSTDDTVTRIRSFSDARIKLVETRNQGATGARNLGFRNSTGDWIQFLDHDDLLHSRKIEIQMRRLLASEPGSVACGSWETFDAAASEAQRQAQALWRDGEPFEWLLSARGGDGIMPTGAWLAPRKLIERAGPWNETLVRNTDDDGEFYSRVVLASERVLFCEDAIFYYRNAGPGNLRMSRSENSVKSLLRTQEIYEERLLAVENTARSRRAAAYGYASFLEMIYPSHPEQCELAMRALDRLQSHDYVAPGSPSFSQLVESIGLVAALRLRHLTRIVLGRPILGGFFSPRARLRRMIALKRLLRS